jgi:hypothetical protein
MSADYTSTMIEVDHMDCRNSQYLFNPAAGWEQITFLQVIKIQPISKMVRHFNFDRNQRTTNGRFLYSFKNGFFVPLIDEKC